VDGLAHFTALDALEATLAGFLTQEAAAQGGDTIRVTLATLPFINKREKNSPSCQASTVLLLRRRSLLVLHLLLEAVSRERIIRRIRIDLPEGGTGGSPAGEDNRPEDSLEGGSWCSVSGRSNKRSCAQRDNATTRQAFVAHKAQNRRGTHA